MSEERLLTAMLAASLVVPLVSTGAATVAPARPLAAAAVGGATALQEEEAVAALAARVRADVTAGGLSDSARAIVRHERPSGSAGENAAIDHIVATLQADGVPVEVHTFDAFTSDPVSAWIELPSGFAPDSITAAFSGEARGLEAPLVDVGPARDLPDVDIATGELLALRESLPDLAGVIALVDGTPGPDEAWKLEQLGALGAVFVNPAERLNELITTTVWGTPSLRNDHRVPSLPVAQVRRGDGERIRRQLTESGALRVRLDVEVETRWRPLRLAVARVEAPGEEAPLVVLGGHIDAWYHGATDEGASNAAMLEIARAFFRQRDSLRRSLWVAWWPGHSNGRYAGSTWFADHFFEDLERRGIAYLNVDGIGQIDARRFGASATRSLAGLARRVVETRVGETVRPGRPGRNSDQAFNGIGLSLLQLNHSRLAEDGGYWWWHTADDTFDKIDPGVLETDAHLYVDALAALLASPAPPLDLVAEVEGLGEVIAARQAEAGRRFDLGAAAGRQRQLLDQVRWIDERLGRGPRTPDRVGLAMARILRPLQRVTYTLGSPYHPDPAVGLGALPGLTPTRILAEEPPTSHRYRLALTTLVRERNRLVEALDRALEATAELRALLGG